MKWLFVLMAMVLYLFTLSGCAGTGKAGMGTMAGMTLGGVAGGLIPQAFKKASPFVQTLSPIVGAVAGGAAGYAYDSYQANKAEEQQRQQMNQQRMQQMLQNTRLSHPIAVQLGQNAYQVQTPQEFAGILAQLQPGVRIMVACNRNHQMAVFNDMKSNGLVPCGTPQIRGNTVQQLFQRSNGVLTPMTMEQAIQGL